MRASWWLGMVVGVAAACGSSGMDAAGNNTPESGGAGAQARAGAGGKAAVAADGGAGAAAAVSTGSSMRAQSAVAGAVGSVASQAGGGAGQAGSVAGQAGSAAGAAGHSGASAGTSAEAGTGGNVGGAVSSGTLPPVMDLDQFGSFTPVTMSGIGPNSGYRLDYPRELGDDGLKHPVFVFAAGGGFPENYNTLIKYVTSHGFVVLSYAATDDQGKEIIAGIDWLIEQGSASSGMLAGKLDVDHIAAGGHSFGSLAAFNAATDKRVTTTVHLSGGTLDPHKEVANLHAPAQFICGESPTGDQDGTWTGDMANPNCEIDFDKATTPVFYGSLKGAAHIQLTEAVEDTNDPLRMRMLGAVGGWLRWRLAGDETQRARYVGDDCELCKPDTGWVIKQKGLM